MLCILQKCDSELKIIGIEKGQKTVILQAIEKGVILLDAPLKSIDEIIDFRGENEELVYYAKKYRANKLVPIESLLFMEQMALNIKLFIQKPDEVLSNRDDNLFIERLKKSNSLGSVQVVQEDNGGHEAYHYDLWKLYKEY